MNEDTAHNGTLTATDAEGNPLAYAKVTDPTHGTLTVNSNGSFTYTPTANYFGTDTFTYSVSDGTNDPVNQTVTITINDVAEPVVNTPPTPTFTAFTMNEDTAHNGTLTATDAEGNPLAYAKVTDPTHGTLTVNANGTFTYTPTANYFGTDTFTYSVSDGTNAPVNQTVTVTVTDVAEPDTTLPNTPTLSINTGASYTNSTSVAISITGDTDNVGVTEWYVAETSSSTPAGGAWSSTEPTTATISAGDGTKTIKVWTKDAAGNVSLEGSDTITLDQTAPTAAIGYSTTALTNQDVVATVTLTDAS